jgi:hypothetical protein
VPVPVPDSRGIDLVEVRGNHVTLLFLSKKIPTLETHSSSNDITIDLANTFMIIYLCFLKVENKGMIFAEIIFCRDLAFIPKSVPHFSGTQPIMALTDPSPRFRARQIH